MKLPRIFVAAAAGGAIGICALVGVPADSAGAPTAGQSCLSPATWTMLDGDRPRVASAAAVMAAMAKEDVVLLGEQHDEDDDHRWQLQVLAALHAQRPDMVIGFEMFPRRAQPVLDRWVAGNLTVQGSCSSSPSGTWSGRCRPSSICRCSSSHGSTGSRWWRSTSTRSSSRRSRRRAGTRSRPEREGVGRAAPASPAYRDFLFEIYGEHGAVHGKDNAKVLRTDAAFARFIESQTAWDRAMAEALARHAVAGASGEKPLVVGIMGSGHIRFGHGVAHQLRDLKVKNVGTLMPRPGQPRLQGGQTRSRRRRLRLAGNGQGEAPPAATWRAAG